MFKSQNNQKKNQVNNYLWQKNLKDTTRLLYKKYMYVKTRNKIKGHIKMLGRKVNPYNQKSYY